MLSATSAALVAAVRFPSVAGTLAAASTGRGVRGSGFFLLSQCSADGFQDMRRRSCTAWSSVGHGRRNFMHPVSKVKLLPYIEKTPADFHNPIPRYRRQYWQIALYASGVFSVTALSMWNYLDAVNRSTMRTVYLQALKARFEKEPRFLLPEELAAPEAFALQNMAYRHYILTGTFEHDREMLVGPRDPVAPSHMRFTGESGYHVLTPFVVAGTGGKRVLVLRGWVPRAGAEATARPRGQVSGEQTITAVLCPQFERSIFEENRPDDEVEQGRWHWIDTPTMAERAGTLPLVFSSEERVPGGYPMQGQLRINDVNDYRAESLKRTLVLPFLALALFLLG